MKNPFPGFNPYLELPALWPDFPSTFINYLISRYEQRPNCHVYAWNLPQPLPTLTIPFRAPDADIFVSLAAVFETAYQRGRFQRRIDYTAPLPGTLRESESRWIAPMLEVQN